MFKMRKRILFILFGFAVFSLLKMSIDVKREVNADTDHQVNSNFTYTYTTTVDDPITLTELINEIDLNAYDSNGNNITSSITVNDPGSYIDNVVNQPTSHSVILGNYQVKYAVYDTYGNRNIFTIHINVIDNQAPVIDESSNAVLEINKLEVNENTFELIKRGIIVSDNHDYELTYEFEDGFDLLEAIGFNQVTLYISDKSGNTSSILMEISIEDTIGPKIYANTTYIKTTNTETPMTFDYIKQACALSAMDQETDDICQINVSYDNYTPNYNKNGVFLIIAYAQDTNGNRTSFYIYVEVEDTEDPVFYLSSTKVTITQDVTFDIEKADELIRARKMAKYDEYELSIEKDEYTLNKEEIGTYIYQVKAVYEDESESLFEFIITVEEKVEEIIDEVIEDDSEINEEEMNTEEVSFFEKIKKGLNTLWKIVKWPFERIGKFVKSLFDKSIFFKKF